MLSGLPPDLASCLTTTDHLAESADQAFLTTATGGEQLARLPLVVARARGTRAVGHSDRRLHKDYKRPRARKEDGDERESRSQAHPDPSPVPTTGWLGCFRCYLDNRDASVFPSASVQQTLHAPNHSFEMSRARCTGGTFAAVVDHANGQGRARPFYDPMWVDPSCLRSRSRRGGGSRGNSEQSALRASSMRRPRSSRRAR